MNKKLWKDLTLDEKDTIKSEAILIVREGGKEKDIEEATGYRFAIYISYLPGSNDVVKGSEYLVSCE
jgi:hypothetical protein